MDKCINVNNNKVKEIAAELGIIPAIAAIKMEVWMNNNKGKIPSAQDLINSIEVSKINSVQNYFVDKIQALQGKQEQFPCKIIL